jgi:hypothetical protein
MNTRNKGRVPMVMEEKLLVKAKLLSLAKENLQYQEITKKTLVHWMTNHC